jgi:hypothetical protein
MNRTKRLIAAVFATMAVVVFPATASASGELFMSSAAPASGPRMEASKYPAALTGERFEFGELKGSLTLLKAAGATASCTSVKLDGGSPAGPLTSFTLNASYSGCKLFGTAVTVEMNSCHYDFSEFTKLSENGSGTAAAIACAPGDSIKIALESACTVRIPSQSLSGPNELLNLGLEGPGPVGAHISDSNVSFTAEGPICSVLGFKTGANEGGTAESYMTLRGMSLTDGIPAAPTQLNLAKLSPYITGERFEFGELKGSLTLLKAAGTSASCTGVKLYSEYLAPPVTSFALTASYSGCKLFGTAVTVEMNSCHYDFSEFTTLSKDHYGTAAAIACNPGDSIKIALESACTVRIPSQSLSGPNELVNLGLEGPGPVGAHISDSNVSFTAEGPICSVLGFKTGANEGGTAESHMTLRSN